MLQRNVSFTQIAPLKVSEIFKYIVDNSNSISRHRSLVQLTIIPKKPLEIDAGQYINICIPSLGMRSFIQSHPFVVASQTGKLQTKLELVVEPRHSWTKALHSRALTMTGQDGGLGRVFFTSPYRVSTPVNEYEFVLMIASGYRVVAHLALLERLVQGTLAHKVRARRIRLAWTFEDIGRSFIKLSSILKFYRAL